MLYLCNKLLQQFDLLSAISAKDTLLLVEEGTYNLANASFIAFCQSKQLNHLYAIASDTRARSIKLPTQLLIELIDYPQYVTLCATHQRIYQL